MTPEKTEKLSKNMVFPHIYRQISARCRRKDQQCIDDQNTYPLDGKHDNQCYKYRKNIIHQLYRNPLALCQCPVNTDGIQPVKTGDPEQNRNDKNNNKIPDFLLVMLRTSPTKRLEYLLKFPPFDRIARPIATEQEEKPK